MQPRVLLVDDNRSFLHAARVLLEREDVGVVGLASTTAEALLATERCNPDVVLVDINLAGESGFDLAARLAARNGGRDLPVILISTHAETDLQELIAGSSAVGFLAKSDLSAQAISAILDARTRIT